MDSFHEGSYDGCGCIVGNGPVVAGGLGWDGEWGEPGGKVSHRVLDYAHLVVGARLIIWDRGEEERENLADGSEVIVRRIAGDWSESGGGISEEHVVGVR